MSNTSKIVIDLSRVNYTRKSSLDDIIHKNEYEQLFAYIHNSIVDNTKEYDKITDCRIHNTIFIDGERGSGKTTFLVNIDKAEMGKRDHSAESTATISDGTIIWDSSSRSNFEYMRNVRGYVKFKNNTGYETPVNRHVKMLILPPIDPTLINAKEDFLLVVISVIKNYLEDNNILCFLSCEEKAEKRSDSIKAKYYEQVNEISQAILDLKEAEKDTNMGIEAILNYQNSLKFEQMLHSFFQTVCTLTSRDVIILRIDDVDMAFQYGFNVLEVLRKYTASPYILPIVTGDIKLYKLIVSQTMYQHIIKKAYDETHIDDTEQKNKRAIKYKNNLKPECLEQLTSLRTEYAELVQDLTEKYLIKVFPFDRQIHLESNIIKLSKKENITFQYDSISFNIELFEKYENVFHNVLIGNKKFHRKTLPTNARLFMQYILKKIHIYSEIKEDTISFTELATDNNITTYRQMLQTSVDFYSNMDDKREFFLEAKANLEAITDNKFSIKKVFESDYFDPCINEFLKIDPESFETNDPSLNKLCINNNGRDDFHLQALARFISNESNIKEMFLMHLFLHKNYYTSQRQSNFLFAGKFVKMIFSSFSSDFSEKDVINILYEPPFMSNISKTKLMEGEDFEDIIKLNDKSADYSTIPLPLIDIHDIPKIAKKMTNKISPYKKGIIPAAFLHLVLNKFFNNVNMYKTISFKADSFATYILRMAYMLLNAVSYFETNSGIVSDENIAMLPPIRNYNTLNDKKIPIVYTAEGFNEFNQDIKFLSSSYRNIIETADNPRSLTYQIIHHPIMKWIMDIDAKDKEAKTTNKIHDILSTIPISTHPKPNWK